MVCYSRVFQSDARPSLSTITSSDDWSSYQGSSSVQHSLQLPIHRSLSSSVRTGSTSPFARPNELPEPVLFLKPTSPVPNSIDEIDEEEDEDGRILLEALGLAEPAVGIQLVEQPNDDYTHNEDPVELNDELELYQEEQQLEVGEHESYSDEPPTPTPIRLRPLPIPPQFRPPIQFQPPVQREAQNHITNVPPPHDSQDAFTYVFGPTPRSSVYANRRESNAPPPPYASRQSAMLDRHRSRPRPEDLYLLEQQLAGLALPEVPPLSIRRRDGRLD